MRSYPKTQGTCVMQEVYGVNAERDKTLKALGYTYQSAKDWFPAFAGYWEARGWSQADFLELYEFEVAWNDWLWAHDTLMGVWGYYRPPTYITQSRAWIQAPDGWYRVRFGCLTGIGRYSGKHANTYSNREQNADGTFKQPGCTPGTALEIDHAGWMSSKMLDRVLMPSSAWTADYGTVGGIAYSEGIIIENFRFVGNATTPSSAYRSYGVAMADPGENSWIKGCMFTNMNGGGMAQMGGTPANIDTCSFFYNFGPGIKMLSTSGLHDTVMTMVSGDNNTGGLIELVAAPNSAPGGTISINGIKSESRGLAQRILTADGSFNIIINGCWANFEQGAVGEELFYINGKNANGGQDWQLQVNGLKFSSNLKAIVTDAANNVQWKGVAAWKPVSFCLNDEGMTSKSRAGLVSSPFAVTPPTPVVCSGWETGPWSAWGPCVNGQQTRTRTVTPTPAGCTGTPPGKPAESETQACSVTPPSGELSKAGWTASATAVHTSGYEGPEKAIDGNPTTRYTSGRAQAAGDNLTITLPTPTSMSRIVFDCQGDYPGSYRIEARIGTSSTWMRLTPTTNPAGAPVMEVSFTKRNVKAYRLVVVGPRPVWLSCQETSAFA